MSVVNRMLNDLESRKSRHHQGADYVPSKLNKFPQYIASALIVVLASVTLVVTYDRYFIPKAQEVTPAQQNQTTKSVTPSATQPNVEQSTEPSMSMDSTTDNLIDTTFDTPSDATIETSALTTPVHGATSNSAAEMPTLVRTQVTNDRWLEHSAGVQEQPVTKVSSLDTSVRHLNATKQVSTDTQRINSVVVQPSSGQQPQVAKLREQARLALEDKRIQASIEALEALLSFSPTDLEARKQLASIQFAAQQVAAAFNTLQIGIEATPNDSSLRLMQSRIAYRQDDKKLALSILRGLPTESQPSDDFLSFRAALAESNREYAVAYNDYRRLLQRYPENAKWWLGLAISQDKLSMPADALTAYRRVKTLNQLPEGVEAFVDERINVLARQSL